MPGDVSDPTQLGEPVDAEVTAAQTPWRSRVSGDVHYPNHYPWLVLVSALDVMLTWGVLVLGGREVNPLADAVLALHGFGGMIAFKFAIVALVIVACEVIAVRDLGAGRKLATAAVVINALPVAWTLGLLATAL